MNSKGRCREADDPLVRSRAGEGGFLMGEPLTSVCVFDQVVSGNNYRLSASIRENGDLEIAGSDVGPFVKEWWHGTDEYEYFFTVPAKEKDAVLLYLLKERYRDKDFELTIWLRGHEIEFDFWNWFSFK